MISCTAEVGVEGGRAAYGWQRAGGHADFLLAEERTLVALPDELSYLDGAMAACGLGTAYAACLRAGISGLDNVLITGLGPVGIGAALLCRAMGARVVGAEAIPERIEFFKQLGFTEGVNSTDEQELSILREETQGYGFEVAIDCSGNAAARHTCLELAREWGRV